MKTLANHMSRIVKENGKRSENGKCTICGQPLKEISFELFGTTKIVYGQCECEKKKEKSEEKKRLEEETKRRIEHLKDISNIPERYINSTFNNFKVDKTNKSTFDTCYDYAVGFKDNLKDGKGLIISGSVGNGKTHLICAVANKLIAKGYRVLYINASELFLNIQKNIKDKDSEDILNKVMNCQVLIIDDIGSEKRTDFTETTLYSIIDYRYKKFKPIITATNLTSKELNDKIGSRSVDRLLETTIITVNKATSYRKSIARINNR